MKKTFFNTFIFLLCLLMFSNNLKAELVCSFSKVENGDVNVYKIDKEKFFPFKNIMTNGLESGWYCIKIEGLEKNAEVSLNTTRVSQVSCLQNNKIIKTNNFAIVNSFFVQKKADVFLIMNCKKEVVVPVSIRNIDVNRSIREVFINGFYYGLILIIFLMGIGYFYVIKNNFSIYFSFMIISTAMVFFIHDNSIKLFIKNQLLLDYFEVFTYLCFIFFRFWFLYYFFEFSKYYKNIKKRSIIFFLIITFVYLTFSFSKNYFTMIIGNVFILIALFINLFFMLSIFSKNKRVRLLFIYGIPFLIVVIIYFIFPLFGIQRFGITINTLKYFSIFEILIILSLIFYELGLLEKQNTKYKRDLFKYTKIIGLLKSQLSELNNHEDKMLSKLNTREQEILNLISKGKTNKEIANELFISVNTVKYHIKNLYEKLNIKSRKEIIKTL